MCDRPTGPVCDRRCTDDKSRAADDSPARTQPPNRTACDRPNTHTPITQPERDRVFSFRISYARARAHTQTDGRVPIRAQVRANRAGRMSTDFGERTNTCAVIYSTMHTHSDYTECMCGIHVCWCACIRSAVAAAAATGEVIIRSLCSLDRRVTHTHLLAHGQCACLCMHTRRTRSDGGVCVICVRHAGTSEHTHTHTTDHA